jgi:two-component system, NarL family, nitrate/nitrite response regulator NarL
MTMTTNARFSILSDNELIREGLRRIIQAEGYEADCRAVADWDGDEEEAHPRHVVLLEGEDDVAAIAACEQIRYGAPSVRLVVMCPSFHTLSIRRGLNLGISGFLTRDTPYLALIRKLSLVLAGEKVLSTALVEDVIRMPRRPGHSVRNLEACQRRLSEKEMRVLDCLLDGDADKHISRRLNMAEPTVKVHVKAILRKLNVSNRTQAAIWALSPRDTARLPLAS